MNKSIRQEVAELMFAALGDLLSLKTKLCKHPSCFNTTYNVNRLTTDIQMEDGAQLSQISTATKTYETGWTQVVTQQSGGTASGHNGQGGALQLF